MPFGVGIPELIVIGAVAVLLFGSRLPEVARNVGASYQQFRKGLYEIQNNLKKDLDTDLSDRSSSQYGSQRGYRDDYDPQPPRFAPPSEDQDQDQDSIKA